MKALSKEEIKAAKAGMEVNPRGTVCPYCLYNSRMSLLAYIEQGGVRFIQCPVNASKFDPETLQLIPGQSHP